MQYSLPSPVNCVSRRVSGVDVSFSKVLQKAYTDHCDPSRPSSLFKLFHHSLASCNWSRRSRICCSIGFWYARPCPHIRPLCSLWRNQRRPRCGSLPYGHPRSKLWWPWKRRLPCQPSSKLCSRKPPLISISWIMTGCSYGFLPRKPCSITSRSFCSSCTHYRTLGVMDYVVHYILLRRWHPRP